MRDIPPVVIEPLIFGSVSMSRKKMTRLSVKTREPRKKKRKSLT
jgi:hypothetical protein